MNHSLNPAELSFEAALKELEAILERLTNPNEALTDLIKIYEEGVIYLNICKLRLNEAEAQITILNDKLAKEGMETSFLGNDREVTE
ncbi:MAG TPA: exodeoxyribonuclease VII small subunit [Candidatus Cloacimonadota bacterium]|nr:exodeoxyribonuclease VII small subunit [Candidatus Cloacimonadota bacterium]